MAQSPPDTDQARFRKVIRDVLADILPEIMAARHLPFRARVLEVKALTAGKSDDADPRYVATVQPLTPDGEEDTRRPAIAGVSVQTLWSGPNGEGLFRLPPVGSIVRVVFDYGDSSLPVIVGSLTEGNNVPDAATDELVINNGGTEIRLTGAGEILLGQGDNAQALGDGLKACVLALIDQVIALCTAPTTMGSVLGGAMKTELETLKTAITGNTGDGEIISEKHKTSKD